MFWLLWPVSNDAPQLPEITLNLLTASFLSLSPHADVVVINDAMQAPHFAGRGPGVCHLRSVNGLLACVCTSA